MNVFTVAGIVGVSVVFVGILIAVAFVRLSTIVALNGEEIVKEQSAYNLALTMGHRIQHNDSFDVQMKDARVAAAKKAAATPRWGNSKIGHLGASTLKPASDNLANDPLSAVKIAKHHTWNGARLGIPAGGEAAVATTTTTTRTVTRTAKDLKPGVDYAFTPITDDMEPAEKRRVRIANSKAKSAAVKALKQSGGQVVVTESVAGAPVAAAAPSAPAPMTTSVPAPVYTELTDDMAPDEKRKARIANSKAKSAYNKALKAAGIDPKTMQPIGAAPAPVAAVAPVAAAPAPAPATDSAALAGIPKPDLVVITADMAPDAKRQARISNSKAKSAYNKALKAAGIDPKSVK